mgnify:CR=1 FL=1
MDWKYTSGLEDRKKEIAAALAAGEVYLFTGETDDGEVYTATTGMNKLRRPELLLFGVDHGDTEILMLNLQAATDDVPTNDIVQDVLNNTLPVEVPELVKKKCSIISYLYYASWDFMVSAYRCAS